MKTHPEHIGEIVPEVLEKYQLKALPTVYGGISYRSRIEARWAVFFDTLRIPHEYEREGFDLGDGVCYLPDFWLPKHNFWIEIKGADPDEDACEKAHRLAVASGFDVFVFFGGITLPTRERPDCDVPRAYAMFPDGAGDYEYCWCECPECGAFGIKFDGRTDRLPCKECFSCAALRKDGKRSPPDCTCKPGRRCLRTGPNLDKGYNGESRRLIEAYEAARRVRFTR